MADGRGVGFLTRFTTCVNPYSRLSCNYTMTEDASGYREIDRWDGGVGWIAYPDETMRRASHVLEADGGSWVIDPVDTEGIDDLLGEFGEVEGVVILLDRHKRDAATVANRHGVSVYVPSFMDGVASELDAPVERFDKKLEGTGYGLYELVNNRFWQEAALYNGERGALFVPEAVGTASYFLTGDEQLGIHPMLRLRPPRTLRRFQPNRIMVGHGEGVSEGATECLREALDNSLRNAPALYVGTLKDMLLG